MECEIAPVARFRFQIAGCSEHDRATKPLANPSAPSGWPAGNAGAESGQEWRKERAEGRRRSKSETALEARFRTPYSKLGNFHRDLLADPNQRANAATHRQQAIAHYRKTVELRRALDAEGRLSLDGKKWMGIYEERIAELEAED